MKKIFTFVVLAAMSIVAFFATAQAARAQEQTATLTVNVTDEAGAPVVGAGVEFHANTYTTDAAGKVSITGIDAAIVTGKTMPVYVYKDGYEPFEGTADFTKTLDAVVNAKLVTAKGSLIVKVVTDGEPVAGASVSFMSAQKFSDNNGEAKFNDFSALEVIGKTMPIEIFKDGYDPYTGEADFTEGMDAYVIAELVASKGTLTVKVFAGEDPVEGATVTFQRINQTTDEKGEVKYTDINAPEVIGKMVPYTVYKDAYEPFSGEADFTEGFDAYATAILTADKASLSVKVMAGEEPAANALVTFLGQEYIADANGDAKITGINAPDVFGKMVPYTAYKDGYEVFEGEANFTEGIDANEIAYLVAAQATLSVKVFVGEDPLQGATVTFMRKSQTTDENGEVKFTDINAPEVIGKTVAYEVYKDAYKPFTGEADFTEGFEASAIAILTPDAGSLYVKVMCGEEPVANAVVTFLGQEYIADANGDAKITGINAPEVFGKKVPYTAYKDGYETFEGEADFTETIDAQEVAYLVAAKATLTVKAIYEEGVVADAWVTFLGKEYTTDENGQVTINDINAPEVIGQKIPVTVYKDGYEFWEGEADFTEGFDAWVIAELKAAKASLYVKVFADEEPVPGATVSFLGQDYTADENGDVRINGIDALEVFGKKVPFTAYKDGYEMFEGEADFTETTEASAVANLVAAKATLTVKVIYEDGVVADAWVSFLGKEYTTDENGQVTINDINAPDVIGQKVPVTVYKDGYEFWEGEADFSEGFDAWVIAELQLAKATLTVKVFYGEDVVADAMVTVEGKEYFTDEIGQVIITEFNALDVLGKKVPVTVYKDGYEPWEGEADFTEGFEAWVVAELQAAKANLIVKAITDEGVVAGATVTFLGKEYTTDEIGEVHIDDINAPEVIGQKIPVTVAKEGFVTFEGEADFTEGFEAYVVAELKPQTSGIDSIIVDAENGDTVVFDLHGRRIAHPQKGQIYIVNGQKVLLNK